MSCRNPVRKFKSIDDNDYGFALATLDVPDVGQGFKCGFVVCACCHSKFVGVWPIGLKTIPCVFCENETVWTK